jgi:hypothetical protein
MVSNHRGVNHINQRRPGTPVVIHLNTQPKVGCLPLRPGGSRRLTAAREMGCSEDTLTDMTVCLASWVVFTSAYDGTSADVIGENVLIDL